MASRGVSTVPVWMVMAVVVMVVAVMNGVANGDVNTDTQECADQLAGMATCLAYVQGQAKAPTPDCCSGLKQVLNTSKKCLCVIVKDGNDPQLALNINVTLALGLPSVCHASANISQCPALLHLDPNSPDAQVFYKYGNTSSNIAAAPGPDIAPGPTAGAGSSASSAASPPMSNDGTATRAGRGEGYSLIVFLWCLMFANLAYD